MSWQWKLVSIARSIGQQRQKIILAKSHGAWIWYCPWCSVYGYGMDWAIEHSDMIGHYNRIHSR